MYLIGKNSSYLMKLNNEYYMQYCDNVGKSPSFLDEEYSLEFEMSKNGKIVAKEFIEEERIKRKELSQKIDKQNKERDLWIVREAYNRYGYEVAEWMARIRKVEMPNDLYPCNDKQAQCNMFCAKYMNGCKE